MQLKDVFCAESNEYKISAFIKEQMYHFLYFFFSYSLLSRFSLGDQIDLPNWKKSYQNGPYDIF